jgi:hypothetical protein
VYSTVVRLCQFFCCGRKVNFVRIPYICDCFSKKKKNPYKTYLREDQLFLALYGSTTIQSLLFLKNIQNFVWFPKQYLLGFFFLEKKLANILNKGFLFLCNTLLLYSLLLWRESNFSTAYTLLFYSLDPYSWTERHTEERIHLLRVGWRTLPTLREGWRNLFSSCAVVSVFVLAGNNFLVLHTTYELGVPYSCGVVLVFLVLAGNSFWCYVHT